MKPLPSSPEDIAENRAGRLSPAQRTALESEYERMRQRTPIRIAAVLSVFVIGPVIAKWHALGVVRGVIVLAVFEALVIALALWITRRSYRRGLETLRTDRVDTVVGTLDSATRSRYQPAYYSRFNGKLMLAPGVTMKDHRKSLEAMPHRVYFLERLQRMVSFERG